MRTLAISLALGALWASILPAHGGQRAVYGFHVYGWYYRLPSAPYGPGYATVGPRVYREDPAEARERDQEHLERGGILLCTRCR